jgi:hypothetical protein
VLHRSDAFIGKPVVTYETESIGLASENLVTPTPEQDSVGTAGYAVPYPPLLVNRPS